MIQIYFCPIFKRFSNQHLNEACDMLHLDFILYENFKLGHFKIKEVYIFNQYCINYGFLIFITITVLIIQYLLFINDILLHFILQISK